MSLPQNIPVPLMQTSWASQLNPLLANPICNGIFLKNVVLATGANKINHLLSRMQQGWIITDQNAESQIYRSAPFNDQTLTLFASSGCTVNLYVY